MHVEPDEFHGILNSLPKFKQLHKIRLSYDGIDSPDVENIYSPNNELIITLAQELTQLKCFLIRYCL